jgi:hypothetical protein
MSGGRRGRPILLLIVIFGLLPTLFVLLVFLPVKKRMADDQVRLEAALKRNQALPNVQPLTEKEKALLADPLALWRTRIPMVENDSQRLAHYHNVVTDVQQVFKSHGISLVGVRSTWNPIKGSFTLPTTLSSSTPDVGKDSVSAAGQLQAWVLETQVDGSPRELFQALETLPDIHPILEPVALRWDFDPSKGKQVIILRNLVSTP